LTLPKLLFKMDRYTAKAMTVSVENCFPLERGNHRAESSLRFRQESNFPRQPRFRNISQSKKRRRLHVTQNQEPVQKQELGWYREHLVPFRDKVLFLRVQNAVLQGNPVVHWQSVKISQKVII